MTQQQLDQAVVDPHVPVSTNMTRYKWTWQGNNIGIGYSTFYAGSTSPMDVVNASAALLGAIMTVSAAGATPQGVTITPDPQVDFIIPTTGELADSVAVTPPATLVGTSSAGYAAESGLCVTWQTIGIINGRRLRGRTFFVPLSSTVQDNTGTIANTYLATCRTAASTYVSSAAQPLVWHRPTTSGGADGQAWFATGAKIQDKAAILSSRR